MVESTGAPVSDDPVLVAFLKELAATGDRESVVDDYVRRYPDREAEFRAMAELRRRLKRDEPPDQSEGPAPERLGDFRIVRQIAHGGMGAIFEAIQEPLGRRVAVKTVLGRRMHLAGTTRDRFLREQQVLAHLHHTHIVPIHAAGSEGPIQYFAMSYIDGAALHHVVRTARLHELSSHENPGHTPTPTLAALAAEAKSITPGEGSHDRNGAPGNRQQPAGEPTTATLPEVEPPRLDARDDDEAPAIHSKNGNGKLILSPEYFRSVARVMLDAAEAVHHAHEAGIIHRDLKPSNLMVDTAEHCWVLDFGLAGYLRAEARNETPTTDAPEAKPAPDLGPEPQQPSVSAVLGTPHYMAPEQFQQKADARTDVWGLGVTLYELLTLRRAFHSQRQIESADPFRPNKLVHGIPRDLEAICWKALRKDPGQRYSSARALADDLRHWIRNEPVRARPAHTLRRVGLWAKRNKGWAAAIVLALSLAIVGTVSAAFLAQARERERSYEALAAVTQILRIRLTPHANGWSEDAWGLARKTARANKSDILQSQAAACLAGLDAGKRKSLPFPGTGLAFDRSGTRLMISGSSLVMRGPEQPIRIWDSTTDQTQAAEIKGDGVFAFRPDGTHLFLTVPRSQRSIVNLWDLSSARLLRSLKSPIEGKSEIEDWAMATDGSVVAASAVGLDAKGKPAETGAIAAWEATTGREIFRTTAQRATDIALAPDASLLAVGHEDGQITVLSLPKGEHKATLKADQNRITRLAFGRDLVRRAGPKPPGSGWLLATGDAGGGVIVWDLGKRNRRSICHGPTSAPEISALAFSPDGMTLASTGRGSVQLWDIASGQFLLDISAGDYVTALAFSPDGRRLAVGSVAAFGDPDSVNVWELEPGRGIQGLRGLSRYVFTATFSRDGRLVGALSNDWHVGIWDRAARRLLHVLEVTPGSFTDNAALAFSPDGRRLAFSAGHEASVWDVVTGELVKSWPLSEGLNDRLAFTAANRLMLFRVETETGEVGPFSEFPASKYPRVCRVRDLLGSEPHKPLAEIRDYNVHVFASECSPDGRYYAIDGQGGSLEEPNRFAKLYEGPTGKQLGPLPQNPLQSYAWLAFDPTGTVLSYYYRSQDEHSLFFLGIPHRNVLRHVVGYMSIGLGPGGSRWLTTSGFTADQPGFMTLHEQDRREPLVSFVLESPVGKSQFSPDGLHLVWGNPSGAVTVVDLVEVNRRLSEIGLGW